jgi:hypothetical protein
MSKVDRSMQTIRGTRRVDGGRVEIARFDEASGAGKFPHVYLGFYPANRSQPTAHPRQPYLECGKPLSYRAIRRWCTQ